MYGTRNDELQLPMDTQLGFLNKLSAPDFRRMLTDAETKLNGNPPLFVFENHDNLSEPVPIGPGAKPQPEKGWRPGFAPEEASCIISSDKPIRCK